MTSSLALDLGRSIADGFESSQRVVMVVEYGKTALVVSLLTLPTPYALYVDESVIAEEFAAGRRRDDLLRDWKILTRWIDDLVLKNKWRTIANVVLTGAHSTDTRFQQAVKDSYIGGLRESVSMSGAEVDPSFHAAPGEVTMADRRMKGFDGDCITPVECCPVSEEANWRLAKSEL